MSILRIDIRMEGPLGTPLRSNTLFGHLCWALRYSEGEAALDRLLDDVDTAPVLLSDAFPHGWLPRPLVAPLRPDARAALADALARGAGVSGFDAVGRIKALQKRRWVAVDLFESMRDRFSERALYEAWLASDGHEPPAPVTVRRAGNRIDRLTSRTPAEGGLYFQQEQWFGGDGPHLWLFADPGPLGEQQLLELLRFIGATGYGRDASTGRGRFSVLTARSVDELFRPGGTRLLSLSRGVLDHTTPAPRYRLATHFGKLGGDRARTRAGPFKHPLLMTEPGATFDNVPGPHGTLLRGVHPALDDVCENGYHLCIAFTEADP